MPHYRVPVSDRADVARALIAAADDHQVEVRTSDSGFYVSEALWDKAFPPEPEPEPEPVTEPNTVPKQQSGRKRS
jgi:hypothetical protein